MIRKEEVFKIGQFGKPHGIKGEIALNVTADLFDEDSDVPYVVCDIEGILVPFFIQDWRYKSENVVLLKLEDVDDESSARQFVNKDVYCNIEEVETEVLDEMEWDNFIGYTVTDTQHGELGSITAIDESTVNVLLQIDHDGEELLIPAADELINEVDHDKKVLTMTIPEGLLDL